METMSPDNVKSDAKLYEGWWMMLVSPLLFGAHLLATYLTFSIYCQVSPNTQQMPGVILAIILAYTLVALGGIAWIGYWSYRRWQLTMDSTNVVGKKRIQRFRLLGCLSFVHSILSGIAVVVVAFLAPIVGACA